LKDCDNSTRKIHINSNFILSISLRTLLKKISHPGDLRYGTFAVLKKYRLALGFILGTKIKNKHFSVDSDIFPYIPV